MVVEHRGGEKPGVGRCSTWNIDSFHVAAVKERRAARYPCAAHHSLSAATASSWPIGPFSSRSSSRC